MSFPASAPKCLQYKQELPLWHNPCGGYNSKDESMKSIPDDKLIEKINQTAYFALMKAEELTEKYLKQEIEADILQFYLENAHQGYPWLPTEEEIPVTNRTKYRLTDGPERWASDRVNKEQNKRVKDKLKEHQNKRYNMDNWLAEWLEDLNKFLQVFAVGIEVVRESYDGKNASLCSNFAEVERSLASTLCEVQSAISVKKGNRQPFETILREDFPKQIRLIPASTGRIQRDWIILRNYIHCLDYIVDFCGLLKELI